MDHGSGSGGRFRGRISGVMDVFTRRARSLRRSPRPPDEKPHVRDDLNEQTVFRLQGLPEMVHGSELMRRGVGDLVREAFEVDHSIQITVASIAAHPLRNGEKIATLSFSMIPSRLSMTKKPLQDFRGLPIQMNHDKDGLASEVVLEMDINFLAFTPLHSHDESDYSIELVALSGLNGHAFGSFKEKGGNYLWLRDDLSRSLPQVRIFIYGYDTSLEQSDSYQSLEDLGLAFKSGLTALLQVSKRRYTTLKPLVLLGHSLGGLVIKEALCKLHQSEKTEDIAILKSLQAVLFFGTPNQGMDITTLKPMVHGQANEHFLRSIGRDSADLRRLGQQWARAFGATSRGAVQSDLEIISFYETKKTPTAVQV